MILLERLSGRGRRLTVSAPPGGLAARGAAPSGGPAVSARTAGQETLRQPGRHQGARADAVVGRQAIFFMVENEGLKPERQT